MLLLALISASQIDVRSPMISRYHSARVQAALWTKDNLPEDSIYGCFWPGTFSFFSQRRVVNLDGIVNNAYFFENYLKKDRIDEYVREENIQFIAYRYYELKIDSLGKIVVADPRQWQYYAKNATVDRLSHSLDIVKEFSNCYYIFAVAPEIDSLVND